MIIDTDQWLSVKDFADKVGESYTVIPHYIRTNRVKCMKHGRDWFVHIDSANNWPPVQKPIGRPRKETNSKTKRKTK